MKVLLLMFLAGLVVTGCSDARPELVPQLLQEAVVADNSDDVAAIAAMSQPPNAEDEIQKPEGEGWELAAQIDDPAPTFTHSGCPFTSTTNTELKIMEGVAFWMRPAPECSQQMGREIVEVRLTSDLERPLFAVRFPSFVPQ